jgi:hypothetical protein
MSELKDRLIEVMDHMKWGPSDLRRVSGQSSSVISQWLGKGSKVIKTIGKIEAAHAIERASGYSAVWLANGNGPKFANPPYPGRDIPTVGDLAANHRTDALVLRELGRLLARVPSDMRGSFADVLAGWARSGGAEDRTEALLALLGTSQKRQGTHG